MSWREFRIPFVRSSVKQSPGKSEGPTAADSERYWQQPPMGTTVCCLYRISKSKSLSQKPPVLSIVSTSQLACWNREELPGWLEPWTVLSCCHSKVPKTSCLANNYLTPPSPASWKVQDQLWWGPAAWFTEPSSSGALHGVGGCKLLGPLP